MVFGAVGILAARRHEQTTGTSPRGPPPVVWGLIFSTSLLIGTILFTVATSDSPRRGKGAARP